MRRDLEERHQTTTLSSAEEKALMNQVKIPSLCSDVMFLLFCTAHCTHIALLSCLSLHAPHFKTPRILQPLSLSLTHTHTRHHVAHLTTTHTHTLSLSLTHTHTSCCASYNHSDSKAKGREAAALQEHVQTFTILTQSTLATHMPPPPAPGLRNGNHCSSAKQSSGSGSKTSRSRHTRSPLNTAL